MGIDVSAASHSGLVRLFCLYQEKKPRKTRMRNDTSIKLKVVELAKETNNSEPAR